MWKAIFVWLGKKIAAAVVEEAARRIAAKRKEALLAEAEAARQAKLAEVAHKEAEQLAVSDNPFDVFKV